jgi:hypothetical protein
MCDSGLKQPTSSVFLLPADLALPPLGPQVLDSSLEAHVLKSDNSGLAKDCRKEIKALNAQLLKLGPR